MCEILITYCVVKLTFSSCDLSKCDQVLKITFGVAGELPKCQIEFQILMKLFVLEVKS